ncbi:MAG: hypothetical protein U5P10_10785 [Spirochaetia bacterium]|nr:hypothetical protein [Spirochaetia bacterium]
MKIICVVKIVPDVDSFAYDYENNTLIREHIRMVLNPDDACALAFALKVKASRPDCSIEVVTMGPQSVRPHVEDLLRLDTDRGTIISDPAYRGSDTYVTSKILARYLSSRQFDVLFTGSHALDGDTSHVPAQIGEELGLEQMSGITAVDLERFDGRRAVFEVEYEQLGSYLGNGHARNPEPGPGERLQAALREVRRLPEGRLRQIDGDRQRRARLCPRGGRQRRLPDRRWSGPTHRALRPATAA